MWFENVFQATYHEFFVNFIFLAVSIIIQKVSKVTSFTGRSFCIAG